MKYALAILLTAGSTLVWLTFLVMLMASGANATPKAIAQIKAWMLVTTVVALGGVGGAAWAMAAGRPLAGAWIGAIPGAFCVTVTVVMVKTEW